MNIHKNTISMEMVDNLKEIVLSYPYKKISPIGNQITIGRCDKKNPVTYYKQAWLDMIDPETLNFLKDNIYPYGIPVEDIRGNIYNKGTYLPLHIDKIPITSDDFFSEKKDDFMNLWTTVITLDKSPDLIGGYTIVGDLSMQQAIFKKTSVLDECKLDVLDPDIGDCYSWSGYLLHGISLIKQGSRLSLAIGKIV